MKKGIVCILLLFFAISGFAQYVVSGGIGEPLRAENDITNKMEVYLLNGLSGAKIEFTSSSDAGVNHQWYKYNTRTYDAIAIPTAGYAGNTSWITDVSEGFGYYVTSSTILVPSYVWIIDYSLYQAEFFSLLIEENQEDKCNSLTLLADVEAAPLEYVLPAGMRMFLSRTYHLQYDNLEWRANDLMFIPIEVNMPIEGEAVHYDIFLDDAPLKNTSFTLISDEFSRHFNLKKTMTTPLYEAIALEVHSTAIPTRRDISENESVSQDNTELGGSAPVEIAFTAYANEPVAAMYIWEIKKMIEGSNEGTTIVRFTNRSLTYTFNESGTFLVQLEVINSSATCTDTSQTHRVFIGESYLRLPNAFSPGSSTGSNDEYRVSYKSLVEFKASIYNRWGNLLFQWNDPDIGWDGRVQGRFVPTGAYFIVVEAKGADGKVYKLSRDINILRSKNNY